ncbi:MAG: hypothetical protein IJN04_00480 [Clostridia bacterium]|nr:hypothetical protein [Clostridia bacterium]
MKKRLLSLLLILALWLSLAGCRATDGDTSVGTTTTTVTATTTTVGAVNDATFGTTTVTTTASKPTTTVAPPASATTAATSTTVTTLHPTTAPTVSAADRRLVDRAFQLATGAKIEGVTLTGIVTSSQGYSAGYNNATFDLQVEGTDGPKTLYCYRVKPADAGRTEVSVGDILTLTGTIQNYKGTIEFYPADYLHVGSAAVTTKPTTQPTNSGTATIDENGIYDSKEEVGLYIHIYGKLPKNYVTKSQYNKNDRYQCVGGDRFYNKEGRLPSGEIYYECDIDTYGITSRGAKRLVWTKSGIVYYTGDHYETFIQLYGER